MRKFSPLWIILLIIWLIVGSLLCRKYICGMGGSAAITAVADNTKNNVASALTNGWLIKDNSAFTSTSPDHFSFNKNNADYLPITAGLKTSVNETTAYLKGHENRSLDITGYYTDDEKNGSLFSNLGAARADKVKGLLLGAGVGAAQINTYGKLLPNNKWLANNKYTKGIEFGFSDKSKEDLRIPAIKERLFGKPVTLYFQTNSDNINLSESQRKDFTDLIYYLDRVPKAKLEISGHTDNVGSLSGNTALSKKRAGVAADYITKRSGISKSKMSIQGFGPNKPVAPNNTEAGKQKNRRVEVTLK